MNTDPEARGGPMPPPRPARTDGLRRVRRMSSWTAAALLVGTGGATVALAHQAVPGSGAAPTTATSTPGTGTTVTTTGRSGPHLAHTVATTSASGVTTTTTTRVVNGRTVVSHARSAPAFHDD